MQTLLESPENNENAKLAHRRPPECPPDAVQAGKTDDSSDNEEYQEIPGKKQLHPPCALCPAP